MKYGDIRGVGDLFIEKPTTPPIKYHNNLFQPENSHVLQYLIEERRLTLETIKQFQLGVDERGDIAIPILKNGDLVNYKFRNVREKVFRQFTKGAKWIVNDMILDSCVEVGYLIITEGEFDAMAVWQMGLRSVISGNEGSHGQTPWVGAIPDEVSRIFINCDNDEPGQEYARSLAEKLGIERCYNVILPTKDANDFIKAGYNGEDYRKILQEAKRFDIKGVKKLRDIIGDLKKAPIERLPTFLPRLNEYTKGGIPRKSMVVMSGDTGIGKSTILLNFLIHHADNGKPVLLVSLENDINFTVQRMLEAKYGRKYEEFDKDMWARVEDDLVDYPFYIDESMTTYTMEKLSKIVDQGKKLYSIDVVGFDHIGFLPNRTGNVVQEVAQMSRDLKIMAVEKDVIAYVISHIRKRQIGQKYISGEDLKDSSSLKQDADMIFFVVPVGKDQFVLDIDKARMSRSKIKIPIRFDRELGIVHDDLSRPVMSFDEELPNKQSQSSHESLTAQDIEEKKELEDWEMRF